MTDKKASRSEPKPAPIPSAYPDKYFNLGWGCRWTPKKPGQP